MTIKREQWQKTQCFMSTLEGHFDRMNNTATMRTKFRTMSCARFTLGRLAFICNWRNCWHLFSYIQSCLHTVNEPTSPPLIASIFLGKAHAVFVCTIHHAEILTGPIAQSHLLGPRRTTPTPGYTNLCQTHWSLPLNNSIHVAAVPNVRHWRCKQMSQACLKETRLTGCLPCPRHVIGIESLNTGPNAQKWWTAACMKEISRQIWRKLMNGQRRMLIGY